GHNAAPRLRQPVKVLALLVEGRVGAVTKGRAMLTEGYMDVLTLHQFGYDNAVGVLGTALTPEQIKRLSGFASQMTLLFDGNRAGRKAALRSCEMLLTRG
ncbi:toprim domain-containing protein, partial [Desulfovibrio desulfuricans]|uniref:toprim domain-containing protein n=1 Tax=Desulfovibrio desulfuricans TaxID=876 RepID=UPI0023B2056E